MIDCNPPLSVQSLGQDMSSNDSPRGVISAGGIQCSVEQLSLNTPGNEELSRVCNAISRLLNQQTQR